MPSRLKVMLSIVVCVVAGVLAFFEHRAGANDVAWVAGFLGLFMVFAVWLFPETRKQKNSPD